MSGLPAAAGFLATTVATMVLIRVARPLGLVDAPGPRHTHSKATPRIGGLALACGLAAVFALAAQGLEPWRAGTMVPPEPRRETWGALAMLALGAVDDRLRDRFRWVWKLLLQAAICGVYALSWDGPDAVAIAAFLLVVVNAMNWFDHANVLLVAAAIPGACVLPEGEALLLGGGLAALLLFNATGRVFAGDAGSHALGFWLASSALVSPAATPMGGIGLAALVLALPLLDCAMVVAIRVARGTPPWRSTRDHLRHRFERRRRSLATAAPFGALAWGLGGGALLLSHGFGTTSLALIAPPLVGAAIALVLLGSPPFRPTAAPAPARESVEAPD